MIISCAQYQILVTILYIQFFKWRYDILNTICMSKNDFYIHRWTIYWWLYKKSYSIKTCENNYASLVDQASVSTRQHSLRLFRIRIQEKQMNYYHNWKSSNGRIFSHMKPVTNMFLWFSSTKIEILYNHGTVRLISTDDHWSGVLRQYITPHWLIRGANI